MACYEFYPFHVQLLVAKYGNRVRVREMKLISIMYFDHTLVFKLLYHWTSVKDGADRHFVDPWKSGLSMKCPAQAH